MIALAIISIILIICFSFIFILCLIDKEESKSFNDDYGALLIINNICNNNNSEKIVEKFFENNPSETQIIDIINSFRTDNCKYINFYFKYFFIKKCLSSNYIYARDNCLDFLSKQYENEYLFLLNYYENDPRLKNKIKEIKEKNK